MATQTDAKTAEEFVVSREFAAPRDLVWKAWTEGARLAQWWGPKGADIRVVKMELKPGGMFHYTMAFKAGQEMWGRFVYREIMAPERLVYVSAFSDPDGGVTRAPFPQIRDTWPLEILNTLTLSERDGKTTLTLRGHPINATVEEMKTYTSMFGSMQQGFGGTLEKLEAHLANTGGSS